ncbi:MAG: aminopeptidase P family protein [Acidobacteriota bacterium]|nr:aminopeptidase P family protein [Acidobacteriota bacterium]
MVAPAPYGQRLDAALGALREHELDALLVSTPGNLRYLTGFTGSNGVALLVAQGARRSRTAPTEQSSGEAGSVFFTDFRYVTQAAAQVAGCYRRWPDSPGVVQSDLLAAVAEELASLAGSRLGFESDHLTVAGHEHLDELLPPAWELVGAGGIVERLREVKDAGEVERIAAAAELADDALRRVLEGGLRGRTERAIAFSLDSAMRDLGAESESFATIVASGQHGALPHATPREVEVGHGMLVTIDWGARLDGYCSDCTRTFASGDPGARAREVYELVLRAQEEALAGLHPGVTGAEADALARNVIEAAGHGEHFGHGLGHGVGLEVHEGPRLSRTGGERTLREGVVVTVEPGVYLPGELGVRIEDLVVLGAQGNRNLSSLPKALTEL